MLPTANAFAVQQYIRRAGNGALFVCPAAAWLCLPPELRELPVNLRVYSMKTFDPWSNAGRLDCPNQETGPMKSMMMIGMRSLAFPAAFGLVVLAVNLSTSESVSPRQAPVAAAQAPASLARVAASWKAAHGLGPVIVAQQATPDRFN